MALGKTVNELLQGISSQELTEWAAFYQFEPWGAYTDYWRAGLITSTVLNVNRTKKSQKAFKPKDFMPKEPGQELSQEELRSKIHVTFQHVAEVFRGKGK